MTRNEYLRSVGFWLRDLPWSTRHDLMAGLRSHLDELPADTDLTELGTPEEYAADLRSAAGLERRRGATITWSTIPVRFNFLWRTATASIPLDEPLTFSFPKGCP